MQDPNFQRQIVKVGQSTYSCYPVAIDQIYKIQQDKAVSSTNSYKQQRKQQNQMTKWVNIEEKAETEIEQCKVDFKILQKQEEEKFQQVQQDNQQQSKPANIKQSEEFTHFVSIPLNYHEFLDRVLAFQTDIQFNIDEKYEEMFTSSSKSHITLCMLKLPDSEKQQAAVKIMQDSQEDIFKIINSEPIEISLEGLGYFSINKDLKKEQATARVVYTKIQKGQGLTKIRKIADMFVKKFLNAGIIEEKDLPASHIVYEKNSDMYELKQIHITLMKQQKAHSVDQTEFDIAEIIKRHQNFKFATIQVHKIDISIRGEVDSTDDFYKPLFRMQI